jgi:hypothetical protein
MRTAARLEAEHKINERQPNYSTPRHIEQREISGELLSHEPQPERVENVVVLDGQQIILGDESNSFRQSVFATEHRHRLAFDLSAREAIAGAE